MHSSSARTPKQQLTAEQLSTGKCWIPPQRDTPRPRAKGKPQQNGRRGEITLESNHLPTRDAQRVQANLVHQDPGTPETEPELCLSVSCGGTGQQWTAAGAGALGAADLDMA